jgi:hypothetical protein
MEGKALGLCRCHYVIYSLLKIKLVVLAKAMFMFERNSEFPW